MGPATAGSLVLVLLLSISSVVQGLEELKIYYEVDDKKQASLLVDGRAGDPEDNSGFIKGKDGIWAVFLFAVIGILTFVVVLALLLRFVCSGPPRQRPAAAGQMKTSSTPRGHQQPLSTSQTQFHNSADNDPSYFLGYNNEFQQNRFQTEPRRDLRASFVSNSSFDDHQDPSPFYPQDYNHLQQQNSSDFNHNNRPYQFLDKYHGDGGPTTHHSAQYEQPTASFFPRVALRGNTPYKVVEDNNLDFEDDFPEEALSSPHHDGLRPISRTESGMMNNRFVRVLPRYPVLEGLRPPPNLERRY